MRILQLVDHWSAGGVPGMIRLITDLLEEDGHEVRIVAYRRSDIPAPIKYHFTCLNARFPGDPHALNQMRELLKNYNPDVIHDHYGGLWSATFLYQKKWRTRSILHVHNEYNVIDDSPDQNRTIRTRLFLRHLLPRYSRIVAVSDSVKNTLNGLHPEKDLAITTVHNAINCEELRSQHSDRSVERFRRITNDHDLTLGFVGRLVYEKGADTIIQAFAELRKLSVNACLIIVGDGDPNYVEQLRRQIETNHLNGHVYLVGRKAAVYPWFSLMDIFFFGSRQEPFGLTLLEAMCAEVPIIALPGVQPSGPDEILEHRKNALILDNREPQSVAQQIKEWLEDKQLWGQIVNGGNSMIEYYSPAAYKKRILDVLNKAPIDQSET
ncbi:MAG: glycosyltransferase [Bacteroidota bacterium]